MTRNNWKWSDANFSSLPSTENIFGITTTPQTNIYLHSKVLDPDGSNKVIIASLAGKIVVAEYLRSFDNLIPSTKEIHFTYIPGMFYAMMVLKTSKFGGGCLNSVLQSKVPYSFTRNNFLDKEICWTLG